MHSTKNSDSSCTSGDGGGGSNVECESNLCCEGYLPPFTPLPRDPSDERFIFNFDIRKLADNGEARDFFENFGFIVFSNVFDSIECELIRSAMWKIIEEMSEGFDRDDPSTWQSFKSAGKYGLGMRGPCFDRQLVMNRQSPYLTKALLTVINNGTMNKEDLMVSHDRFTIYRATIPCNKEGEEIADVDGSKFTTGDRNVHLDLNPWWWKESSQDVIIGAELIKYNDTQDLIKENNLVVESMGEHVQCVLNFAENLEEDGGTMIVPCYHKYLQSWNEKHKQLRKPLPWLQYSKKEEGPLLELAQRVPMREGSVLIWKQVMVHGTSPNESKRCRLAQFLKAFSRSRSFQPDSDAEKDVNIDTVFSSLNVNESHSCEDTKTEIGTMESPHVATESSKDDSIHDSSKVYSTARLRRRAKLIMSSLESANALECVSELGIKLFGLDCLQSDN